MAPLPALWLLLREPRTITAFTAAIWLALGIAGLSALLNQPLTMAAKLSGPLTYTWGAFLLLGGILGVAGCLAGWFWVERCGIIAVATGALVYGAIVLSLHYASAGNRIPQSMFVLAVLLSLPVRWQRIKGAQTDPTKGLNAGDLER